MNRASVAESRTAAGNGGVDAAEKLEASGGAVEIIEAALERHARARREHPLLVTRTRSWTYLELWQASLRAAESLIEDGVRAGDRVVLRVSHKDASFVVGYFGVHLAGAIAVPVDEKTGARTRESIDEQVQPVAMLTSEMIARFLRNGDESEDAQRGMPLPLERRGAADPGGLGAAGSTIAERSPSLPDGREVADIMFTSGTTGLPKGVALTHGAIAAAAANINSFLGNGADDREVVTVPLSHSFGLGRLRCTVLAGGTLILVPGLTFPSLAFEALQTHSATGLVCVPAGAAVLLKADAERLAACRTHLRYMELGSAPMPVAAKRALMSALPRTRICMHYGLTEASRSAFLDFHADQDALESVGRPAPQVAIEIRSDDGRRLAAGEPGRIVIRAATVMKEYWRNPELTTRALDGGGWLDTHDLGRLDERGYLYLDGRRDDVINVGGRKLYPIAVEAVAVAHSDVVDAACVGEPDPDGLVGHVVVLYVVPRDAAHFDASALRTYIAEQVDSHAVPRRIETRDSLPRTSSGKLQRGLLRSGRSGPG